MGVESKIVLVPLVMSDFELLISWVDSAYLLQQFSGEAFTYPLTAEQLVANSFDVKRSAYMVLDIVSGKKVGYAELYKVNSRTIKLARLLIGREFRGLGYGGAMVATLLQLCFSKLKTKQVFLNVYVDNSVAISCYQKFGFVFHNESTHSVVFEDSERTSQRMILCAEEYQQNKLKMEPKPLKRGVIEKPYE